MNGQDFSQLVTDLGDSRWDRREIAERELLARGLSVAKLLEEATRSTNLELAYRAKYILSHIAPNIIEYQILRLEMSGRELEEPPRVVAVASKWAPEGEKVEAQFVRIDHNTSATPSLPTFALTGRTLSDGRVEIAVSQTARGRATALNVGVFIAAPDTATLLTTSEESDYRRLGLHVEREYTRIVTVLRVRRGRQSLVHQTPPATSADSLLAQLLGQLREELGAGELQRRKEALDLLSRLRVRQSAELLGPQLEDPATRALASLCTDDIDFLTEVVSSTPAPGVTRASTASAESTTGVHRTEETTRVRAAIRLLELGDETALELLLQTLWEGNRLLIHPVMIVLADSARAGTLSPGARRNFLEAVFSEVFLARAAWNDVETAYLVSTAIALLEPTDHHDAALADTLLSRLKSLLRGELGQASPRFGTGVQLWRQLSGKLSGGAPSEVAFIVQVLPALRSSANLSAAFRLLTEALESGEGSSAGGPLTRRPGELDDEELALVLRVILDGIGGTDEIAYRKSHDTLHRISRLLTLQPGQLRPVVENLIRAAELSRAKPKHRGEWKHLQAGLYKWTGLAPHKRRRSVFDATAWTEWLTDDERVAARENKLLGLAGQKEVPSEGRKLIYYEFDLHFDKSSPGDLRGGGEKKNFEVLDGRRLVVSPSESRFYRDRWGNRLVLRLTGNAAARADGPVRFRASNLNKYLFTGRLELTNVGGKEFSLTRYETSVRFLGSRSLRGKGATYRSLVLLQFSDQEPSSPPSGAGVESLWQWFLDSYLLHVPPEPTQGQIKDRLRILKTLKVGRWCAPFLHQLLTLRELLKTDETVEIAQDLHRLGDEAGTDFLRGELSSESPERRLGAARGLCELGLRAGVEALLKDFDGAMDSRKVLNSLDIYLQLEEADAEGREQVLDFLISKLTHSGFQSRAFTLLRREAGTDFGYPASETKNPEQRGREIQSAVTKARSWWRDQKAATQ